MNERHPLGQLIQSVEDGRGWSIREIARRIDRAGGSMAHTYIARLKREPITSITHETIRALAAGLDVPERTVGLAALESMGVHDVDRAEPGLTETISRDPALSDRDRRILLSVVREMRSERDGELDGGARVAAGGGDERGGGRVGAAAGRDGVTPTCQGSMPDLAREDFDLAAKQGRNRGAELRDMQDRAAEDG